MFFAFLIIDFMLILIFSIKQMTAGIITCACVLVGAMFLALIIAKVNERKSMKAKVDIGNGKASIVDNDKFMQETENILKQDNDKDRL